MMWKATLARMMSYKLATKWAPLLVGIGVSLAFASLGGWRIDM